MGTYQRPHLYYCIDENVSKVDAHSVARTLSSSTVIIK